MAEFWARFIQKVINRGRVEKVAVYRLDGNPITSTPNCDLWQQQVRGIVAALVGPNVVRFKVTLLDKEFKCLKVRDDTLVGCDEANLEMFVAHQIGDSVVAGFGQVEGPGSCIYELQQLYLDIKQGDLIDLDESQISGQITSSDPFTSALEVNHCSPQSDNSNIKQLASLDNMRKINGTNNYLCDGQVSIHHPYRELHN